MIGLLWQEPTYGKLNKMMESKTRDFKNSSRRDSIHARCKSLDFDACRESLVTVHRVQNGELLLSIRIPKWASCVAFSPDSKFLAAGSGNFDVKNNLHALVVHDIETGRVVFEESLPLDVWWLAFSPDGRMLAAAMGLCKDSGQDTGCIRIWSTVNWKTIYDLRGHNGCVWSVAFNPSGTRLASAGGHWIVRVRNAVMTVASICATFEGVAVADDWPMLGRDGTRNSVSPETGAPTHWSNENSEKNHVGRESSGIRWSAPLGSETHSSPVVSDGLVWIGTNNPRPNFQAAESLHSVLKCFRVTDGQQLYEYISPKFGTRTQDAGWTGLGSSPLIEGDRLWLTTNRSEVLCWDIGPLIRGEGTPRELWTLDLFKTFDSFPDVPLMGPARPCSIGASWNGRIFVTTNNGVSEDRTSVPKPDAANLVCLNKDTGEVYWKDSSPGSNILFTQLSSPTVATICGQTQVIVPQSDGWVRAFDPMTGEKIWEFDINVKESIL